MGKHLTNQWELASNLQERHQPLLILTTAWTDRWVKASLPLQPPPGLSVVSSQQGGLPSSRCWEGDMIRIIWFRNEMRMGELCCQRGAEGWQQRAEGNCSPVHGITKEIQPRAMHRLMAGNGGTWWICTTPLIEKTFNLRKIRLSQLPLTRVPV